MPQVRGVADALATCAPAEPLLAAAWVHSVEAETEEVLEGLANRRPCHAIAPRHNNVNVSGIGGDCVESVAAPHAEVVGHANKEILSESVKEGWWCGRSAIILCCERLVGWLIATFLILHKASRMIGVPRAIRVIGKEIDRHCQCYARTIARGGSREVEGRPRLR